MKRVMPTRPFALGYMMLAWGSGLTLRDFHLYTTAFFQALLSSERYIIYA